MMSASLIQALLHPEAYDHPVQHLQLLETHISWVILTGPYAYKIKKPVDFGFVNFSTPARRRWFCQEELRLNRRLAPELYLDLRSIGGSIRHPHFAQAPAALAACPDEVGDEGRRITGMELDCEVAVRMRQFPQSSLLPEVLTHQGAHPDSSGERAADHLDMAVDDLADRLAHFHASAAVAAEDGPFGAPDTVLAPAQANLDALGAHPAAKAALPALQTWTTTSHGRLAATFTERKRQGHIRECHGDLHLGNMVLLEGRITVFDCLEFSPELRWIDTISEIAFLVMDLGERGQPRLGARLLNRWLEQSGDYAGLATWRWYVVYRALVRAKVTGLRLAQAGLGPAEVEQLEAALNGYLQLASRTTMPSPRALVITHGVSGTGKSHVSRQLSQRLAWIQLRSDVERKRAFGRWGEPRRARFGGDPYRMPISEWLFADHLPELAESLLQAGFGVIVDATFLRREDRRRMRDLAGVHHVPFVILDFSPAAADAGERIARRREEGSDPSDADQAVLEAQQKVIETLGADEADSIVRVEPGSSEEDLAARLLNLATPTSA